MAFQTVLLAEQIRREDLSEIEAQISLDLVREGLEVLVAWGFPEPPEGTPWGFPE